MVSMFIICNAFEVSGVFYCFICIAKKKKNCLTQLTNKKRKRKIRKTFLKFISNQNSLPLLGLDPFKINF